MRGHIVGVMALVSAGAAACDAFSSEGTPAAADAGSDASTPSPDAEPGDGGASTDAARKNLLLNGDFESGCGGWGGTYVTLTSDPNGRDGGAACLVCRTATVTYTLRQDKAQAALTAGLYTFQAYVRAPLDAGTATGLYAGSQLLFPDGGNGPLTASVGPALTPAWQSINHVFTIAEPVEAALTVYIQGGDSNPGECFLVDDAVLYGP